MSDHAYPTSLGASTPDTISLFGHDLAEDLMGQVGFGELAFWLLARRRPTPGEVRVFETVLVALADPGFPPPALAARMTGLSAPASLQGAIGRRTSGSQRPSVERANLVGDGEASRKSASLSRARRSCQ